jgi:hypothetical protein
MTSSKKIWSDWCEIHRIAGTAVPLFAADGEGRVKTQTIGRTNRREVLRRHPLMEELILRETDKLVSDWNRNEHRYDGIIYLMLRQDTPSEVTPLYIGKAETIGRRGDGNLSANVKDLHRDKAKFARWGDNYKYHLGDLSAAALPGHEPHTIANKYRDWAKALFLTSRDGEIRLKHPVYFWTKAWDPTDVSIWRELSPTRLSFLEYLLIGIASSTFPGDLLNREGHNRESNLIRQP